MCVEVDDTGSAVIPYGDDPTAGSIASKRDSAYLDMHWDHDPTVDCSAVLAIAQNPTVRSRWL
jgi:hypothetical protein